MPHPLAYFLTFTTYGSHLHGHNTASIDQTHNTPNTPFLPPNLSIQLDDADRLKHSAIILDSTQRQLTIDSIIETCTHRNWPLHAAHARTNHVHLLLTSNDTHQDKILSTIKAYATRKLRQHKTIPATQPAWSHHGSTRWINTLPALQKTTDYILNQQGPPMAHHPKQ